jgi:cobalt/nickel transport system ATP-binding protein
MAEPVFEVCDVKYSYHRVIALNGVSLMVEKGRRIALLGANGSGKSTLLRVLDALYFPQAGSVLAFGELLTEERLQDEKFAFSFRRRVGMVFQNPDVQLFNSTVFDEVAFGPLQLRWSKEHIRRRVTAILEFMGIAHLKDRPPHHLSGGEKKRVALASVLILDPEVLLLDEPTAALDPQSQSQVLELMIGWAGGVKTVIVATHDLDSVEDIADDCYVLQNGRIVAHDRPTEILHDEALLSCTGLIHVHRHIHAHGEVHAHNHLHRGHLD